MKCFSLIVFTVLPEFRVELTDITVKKGEDITFYCESKTKVDARWMKENVFLENGDRITISEREKQIFTLKIRKVKEEDAGQYTIELCNSAGKISATATARLLDLSKDWRKTQWQKNTEMTRSLQEFKPKIQEVKHLRFLLLGPAGVGKSSIINSISSIFLGRPAAHALTATGSDESFTKTYSGYAIEDDQKVLPFIFNDILGLENKDKSGVMVEDIISALKGHISEGYKFNPTSPLCDGNTGYNSKPSLNDKVHCLVNVMNADKIHLFFSNDDVIKKMNRIRETASDLGIPQVVFLTHVDEACPLVSEDLKNIYKSRTLKERMRLCSNHLGIPMNFIFLVKNYHEETDMDEDIDMLILTALKNIVRFADDYVTREQKRS